MPNQFTLPQPKHEQKTGSVSGFTLIELLFAITILVILVGLAAMAASKIFSSATKLREVEAARELIIAYNLAASDTGTYLPGYDKTVNEVQWPGRTGIAGPIANRYPFRLGPYFDYQLKGVILVNRNEKQIDTSNSYEVSLSPAFGINAQFAGGYRNSDGSFSLQQAEVVTRPAKSGNIIVFATAAYRPSSDITIDGYNQLTPPRIYGPMWSTEDWSADSDPADYGHLHARHNGKVIAAYLDGSVQLQTIEQLNDMRLWSMRAASANDPNYTATRKSPPGRGRR